MKIDSSHLTYCTNIHAGESWAAHFASLQQHFPGIKAQVSAQQPMGIGLRLSHMAALELEQGNNLPVFQQWLQQQQSYVFTMNGFPYGGFHHTRVKDQVHAPDWTTTDRVDYTIRLFRLLSKLLPPSMEGGISTSPLSYRGWHSTPEASVQAAKQATQHMLLVAEELIRIRQQTGVLMHLDIEPEPDGLLETGEEFMNWYEQYLLPAGMSRLAATFQVDAATATTWLKDHICLCYDVCHFAIGYEPHETIIQRLADKGIKVGKIQVSAALQANLPADLAGRQSVKQAFAEFDEPTYLHQVVARCNDRVIRYPDLPEALADIDNPDVKEWRAHFHVPVFVHETGIVQTTQPDILRVLAVQRSKPFTAHLEVETYTWEVLPPSLKLGIGPSIIRELNWVKQNL